MTRRTASSLFGFAPDGVYLDGVCCQTPGALLPHPFTLTIIFMAVCFLWHFPWGYPRRALPGILYALEPGLSSHNKLHAAVQPPDKGLAVTDCSMSQGLGEIMHF